MTEKLKVGRYQCGFEVIFPISRNFSTLAGAGVRFHFPQPPFLLRDVVSWRCSAESKKGCEKLFTTVIHNLQRHCDTKVSENSRLPAFLLPSSSSVVAEKKTFSTENLISFFDYFLPLKLNEDLVRNVLIYGSRKSRCCYVCCFFHESKVAWNKSWIYYLRYWWCMSFNLHFLSGKGTREKKKWRNSRFHLSFRCHPLAFCRRTIKQK